jgi:cell wall-associated NlpC family hydrolase
MMRKLTGIFLLIFLFLSCFTPPRYRSKTACKKYSSSGCTKKSGRRYYRSSTARKKIVQYAKKFIGIHYVYGGASPSKGFDCSGLTSYVYKNVLKISLPRSAYSQSRKGYTTRHPKVGDLMFFITEKRRISHVGIYIGGNSFIHAPGRGKRVQISSLKNSYWKKAYRYSKRII